MTAVALGFPINRLLAWSRRLAGIDAPMSPAQPFVDSRIAARKVDPKRIGKGFIDERQAGKARIVVTVEQQTLERVRERAVARGVPVAVIIREFVELGLAARDGRQ
jgi:hypothetical protein